MIVYLYGPDSYRRGEKLRELLSLYKKKNPSLDMRFFDFEESVDDWMVARDFLEQPSIFQSAKCAVIRGVTIPDTKEWIKTLKFYIEKKNLFLIISDDKKPKKAFAFLTEKPVVSQKFEKLVGTKLTTFLKNKAEELGVYFSPDGWKFFIKYVCENGEFLSLKISGEHGIWLGMMTLKKLSLMRQKKQIQLSDVEQITNWFSRDKVYILTKQIMGTGDWKKKLAVLEKAFFQKEDPSHIFNSLSYGAYGRNALLLADYDVSIKSGKLEYEEALLDFVLRGV